MNEPLMSIGLATGGRGDWSIMLTFGRSGGYSFGRYRTKKEAAEVLRVVRDDLHRDWSRLFFGPLSDPVCKRIAAITGGHSHELPRPAAVSAAVGEKP